MCIIYSSPHTGTDSSLCAELSGVLGSLWELLSPCITVDSSRPRQYTKALYQVVSNEDGCLVHSLQASTSILRVTVEK